MMKSIIAFGITATILAGCASLSPAGLIAASQLDPLETAPEDFIIAVGIPDTLHLQDGDAILSLGYNLKNGTSPVETKVPLTISKEKIGPRAAEVGETIYVLDVSPENAKLLSAAQLQIKALKARNVDGEGSLGIHIQGGCYTSVLGENLPVSTWLKVGPNSSFITLTRKTNLVNALPREQWEHLKAKFVPC